MWVVWEGEDEIKYGSVVVFIYLNKPSIKLFIYLCISLCSFLEVYVSSGGTLTQVAQRSCGCPIPGSVLGQVEWGLEQTGVVEGVHACGRGLELDGL